MTLDPGPLEPRPLEPVPGAELRARARRQARQLSPGLVIAAGSAVALLLVAAFVVLDYTLGADPHRLIKLLLGGVAFMAIVSVPPVGMFLFPIATPLMPLFPKLPVPGLNTLNVFLLILFLPFALSAVLRQKPFLRQGTLTWPLVAFVGMCALSIVRGAAFPTGYAYEAADASLDLFRSAMSFAGYFIYLAMGTGRDFRRRIGWAIVLAVMVESIYTMQEGRDLRDRAGGSIGQSNELGAYLAMFGVFSLALLMGVKLWWQRVLLLGTYVLATIGVILSVSRGGLLSLALATIYVAARSSRGMLVLTVIALATSPIWTPEYVHERIMMTLGDPDEGDEAGLDPGAESRVNTWQTILHIVQDHAIEGIGYRSLGYVLPKAGEDLGLRVKNSSHNSYLRFLAELGIFGVAVFLFVLYSCFALAETGIRRATDRFDRQLAVGLSAATLALVTSCWFGDRFLNILITGNLWVACALVDDAVQETRAVRPVRPVQAAGA